VIVNELPFSSQSKYSLVNGIEPSGGVGPGGFEFLLQLVVEMSIPTPKIPKITLGTTLNIHLFFFIYSLLFLN
jgi:hypothetical protein